MLDAETTGRALLDRDAVAAILHDFWRDRRIHADQAVRNCFAEDSVWRFLGWPEAVLPGPRAFHGWSEVAGAARIIDRNVEILGGRTLDLIVEGEEAALLRVVHLRHRATGVRGELAVHDRIAFRRGRIVRYDQFLDTDAFTALLRGEEQPVLSRKANDTASAAIPERAASPAPDSAEARRRRRQTLFDFAEGRMRDGPAALAVHCTEDFTLQLVGDTSRVPFARRHAGRAAVADLLRLIDREFALLSSDIRSIIVDGDRAAMHFVMDLKHRGTSRVGRNESLIHVVFEDDRVAAITEFFDTARTATLIEG